MFNQNKDFYPTPYGTFLELIKGLSCADFGQKTILEPSAGKGDIVKHIKSYMGSYRRCKILAMENDPDLQAILSANEDCKLIGQDFLNDPCHYSPDFIIMNPPFSKGGKHLLRAWDILQCGEIRCILNAETYNNQCTKERQLLGSIIDKYGTIVSEGAMFTEAERTTKVNCIIVSLKKEKATKDFDLDLSGMETEKVEFPDLETATELVIADALKNKELYYQESIKLFKEASLAFQRFKRNTEAVARYSDTTYNPLVLGNDFNGFIEQFNKDAWTTLLNESKFQNYLTDKVKKEFVSNFQRQANLAFTKGNMMQMFSLLMQNGGQILDSCVLEVFDTMTQYYHENRTYIEGWKTNDAYKVNMKVILPRYIRHDVTSYSPFQLDYSYKDRLDDIDRAMCYLTGFKMEDIKCMGDSLKDVMAKCNKGEAVKFEADSHFFKLKFFKKGTLHLEFKNKLLWEYFNCCASKLRGYPLPEAAEVERKFKQKGLK